MMENHDGSKTCFGAVPTPSTAIYRYPFHPNQIRSTNVDGVEMAQEELYSGPVAESLPSSLSAFSHRRSRANSTTSFTYYDEVLDEPEDNELSSSVHQELHLGYIGGLATDIEHVQFLGTDDEEPMAHDLAEPHNDYTLRRCSSTHSRNSVHAHLLRRDSTATAASSRLDGRISQKIYMVNEDHTIAIAGFQTSTSRFVLYILICLATFGVALLLFRWMPRLYITVVGRPHPLRDCDWVAIENQWGELAIMQVNVQAYGRPLSTVFGLSEKVVPCSSDDDPDPLIDHLRTLNYRYIRLNYHPLKDKYVLSIGWKDAEWSDVRAVRAGLDSDERTIREVMFGNNLIDIEQKPMGKLLIDEALHPFYIFQIASLVLWSLDSYYYYAICIFVMSVGSITTTLIETRATLRRLRELSRFECDVRVLRNGFWKYVSSGDLVPGDVYELSDPNLTQFPSDSLLLTGDCIVNESMLTGESLPVSKMPATNEALREMNLAASSVSAETARHFLFCGTKIIRTRRPQESQDDDAVALALVVRTGFNTTKGALVRSMLFPKPSGFKFYRDSFRYITVMAIIALFGFVASLINFVRLNIEWHLIIVRALDLITIVVPPALPATLSIGTSFALARLKEKQIFCISPQRVNVAGKLDMMCFDKTGTLTEDGLDVLGIRVVTPGLGIFGEILSRPKSFDSHGTGQATRSPLTAILHTMATCHSLRSVDEELVGDPLDLKMFEFTGWSFEEGKQDAADGEDEMQGGLSPSVARPPDNNLQLGVLKSFEFVSRLRRASVIVRRFGEKGSDVFVKGAPEAMREICRQDSFPKDYDKLLSHYTHKGYRVIACASRHLNTLSWVKAQKMTRGEVESDLTFVGFIIFENKLKSNTAGVIAELIESNINAVMVTGDNILTAISVARECGLVDRNTHCFTPRFVTGNSSDPTAELRWESTNNNIYCLENSNLLPCPAPPEGDISLPYDISNLRNYSLAISGEVFRWIVDYAPIEVLHKVLIKGKVFARMSPDEKHELVEKLQSIGYSCGFCGDGANDCGALKAADVGISLSEAEASVAAPFTSRIFDIRCVLEVIREGRAALVTSFSCFKYMSLYSAIQFTTVSFLYSKASNLGDFQFLFIDLLLILPIAIFMSWAGPASKLCRKRPTASLVSRKVLTPLLGLMFISIATQAVAYATVKKQPWYQPPKKKHEESNIKSSDNTALFLVSCFQYVFSGVVFNAGPPFRQHTWQNGPFVIAIFVVVMATIYMLFTPAFWLIELMQLTKMSWDYKLFLSGIGFLYLAAALVYERHLAPFIAKRLGHFYLYITGRLKIRKQYKLIEEGT